MFRLSEAVPKLLRPSVVDIGSRNVVLTPLRRSSATDDFNFRLGRKLMVAAPDAMRRFSLFCCFSGGLGFHRVHDIYPIEVLIVLIRLFRVPNRSIGRCIDNRKDYTSTVGTCSGNDAGVSDVIGVGDIGTYIQPTAYLVVDIGTEAVSFEVRTFQNTFSSR